MKKLSKQLSKELESLSNKCYEITGKDFNLNSPKQLSEIFYDEMKFPVLKKTPKGAPSTDASVLEELSKEHDLPKYILKYRELEKIRSTYVKNVLFLKEFKKEIIDRKRIKIILKNIKNKSIKKGIDPKISYRIWKNMIYAFIEYEYKNFKKKVK